MRIRLISFLLIIAVMIIGCDLFTVGLGEDVDIKPPEIFITNPSTSTTEYKSSDFLIEGTFDDDISSVSIVVTIGEVELATEIDGTEWFATIPINEIPTDGTLNIKAVATDTSGKESAPAYVNVEVDRTAPTVLVSTPQVYTPEPTFSDYVVIQGEAWDASPLQSVTVEVWDPASPTTVIASAVAEGDRSWFSRITFADFAGFTNTVLYRYRIIAVDAAGNQSTYHYHASDIWSKLPVGKLFPAMVDIGKWDQQGTAIPDISGTDLTTLSGERLATTGATALLAFVYDGNINNPQITLSNLDPALPVEQNVIGERVPIYASALDDKEGIATTATLDITGLSNPAFTLSVPATAYNSPGSGLYSSFQFDLINGNTLVPGRYRGLITVEDRGTGASSVSVDFIVDSGAPVIESYTPSDLYIATEANGDVLLNIVVRDDNPFPTPGSALTAVVTDDADSSVLPSSVVIVGVPYTGTVDSATVYYEDYLMTVSDPVPDNITVSLELTDSAALVDARAISFEIDRIDPVVTITTPSDGSSISGTAVTSGGTASTDALQVYVVLHNIVLDGTTPSADLADWEIADGNQTWSLPLDLSDPVATPEGNYRLFARAIDIAGNTSTIDSNDFAYDIAAPTLVETTIGVVTSVDRTAVFSMSGTASDSNGMSSVSITQAKDGGAAIPISTNGPTTGDGWANWSLINLPRDPADIGTHALLDGDYEYVITATDIGGRDTTITRTVRSHATAPSGVIQAPAAAENVGGASYTFSGTAADAASGVKTVEYSFDNSTWIVAAGTENWSATVDLSTIGAEGPKTVYLRVEDWVGKLSTDVGTISQAFVYDTAVPALSIDGSASIEVSAGFSVTGTASDSYGVASVGINQQKDGGAIVDIDTNGPTTGDGWATWALSNLPRDPASIGAQLVADGVYVYSATATDDAGKTSVAEILTVTIDSTAPDVLTITNPAAGQTGANSLSGSAYTLRGTATDAGVGVAKVYYLIDTNAAAAAGVGGYTTILTGDGNWSATLDFDTDGPGPDTGDIVEGSWYLHVKAEDGAGNVTADGSAVSVAFDLDYADPTLDETNIGTAVTTNTQVGYDFVGTSTDSNGVTSVSATQSKDGGAVVPITTNGPTTGDGWDNWSLTNLPRDPGDIGNQSLVDGTYDYIITATDVAGKLNSITRTMRFDSTGPTVTIDVPVAADVVSTANTTVAGTADDGTGTGVALVEYSLDNTNWFSLNGTTNWNKSIALGAEGPKTLYVRAEDQLSIQSATETVSFNLDLTSPNLDETGLGPVTSKQSLDFTLSGTASDTNGLKTWDEPPIEGTLVPYVEVALNGGAAVKVTVDGGNNWSYNQSAADVNLVEGDNTFVITATDIVDKVSTVTRFVTFDETAPTIAIDGVIGGLNVTTGQVNGVMTFRFNADDSGVGLDKSGANYVAYYKVVDDAVVPPSTAADIAGWTQITSASTVFSFTYDTATAPEITGPGDYDLYIGVLDAVTAAPNSDTAMYDIAVDQDSDRPIINVDNLDVAAVSNNINGLGQNPSILVTIQDDDSVSVADLEYRIDANNDDDFLDIVDHNTDGNQDDLVLDDKWEDESVWYAFDDIPGADQSLVQGKIILSNFPQGLFGLEIRARDTTDVSAWAVIYGDNGNYTWATTTTDAPTNAILFSVDYGPPSLGITAPTSGTYNADFALTGTAIDALGVIDVKYSLLGPVTSLTDIDIFDGDQGTVNISETVNISTLDTGEYILQVVATDQGNSSITQQIPITLDKDAPTTNILQPVASATLNGSVVTVTGEAFDNRLVGAVFLWHGLVSAGDPALPARTGPGTYNAGGYTQLVGTSLWTTTIDTTAETATAVDAYRIRVVAIDDIGNVGTPEEQLVTIDQASDRPIIEFSNLSTVTPSRLGSGPRIIGTVTDDDSVDDTKMEIRLDRNGDGDYLDAEEGWMAVSDPPTAPALVVSWIHEIPDAPQPISQGKWYVEVRAIDIYGTDYTTTYATDFTRGETTSVEFFIDYGPPTLTITAPTSGQRFNANQFTLTGTTNDGNGVDYYTVWVDDNDDQVVDFGEIKQIAWVDVAPFGTQEAGEVRDILPGAETATGPLTTDDTPFVVDVDVTGLSDGVKAVQVISYDTAGAGSVRDFTVVIDTTDPTASFSTPSAGATINGVLTISGLASDNYQLSDVYYHIGLTANPAPAYPGDYTALGQTYSWSFALDTADVGDLPDGDGAYTIRIVPLDSAGNFPAAPYTRAIDVDQVTDRPLIQLTSITEGNTAIQNLLPGDKVITGTIQDDDEVSGTSIQVQFLNAAGDTVIEAWHDATTQPADGAFVVWSDTVNQTDGQYQVQVRAYDTITGAYSGFGYDDRFQVFVDDGPGPNDDDGVNFAIDSANPVIAVTDPVQNFFTNGNEDKNGNGVLDAGEDDDGSTTLDSAGVLPFYGTASDGSGITTSQVRYRLQGAPSFTDLATAGTTAWSASVDTTIIAEGVYDWQIEAVDPYGKSSITDRIFTLDKTAPEITISSPAAAADINGSMLVQGTATDKWQTTQDGFQVTSVRVWIGAGDTATASAAAPATTDFYLRTDGGNPNHDASNWKELTGTSNWSYRFDTTALNGLYTILVVALDSSGNISSSVAREVNYDQSLNLPVVTLSNMSEGEVTGTLDSATTTTLTDAALDGNTSIAADWYVSFTTITDIRKITGFDDGTDTVTFTPALALAPAGDYIIFPNVIGAAGTVQGEITDDDGVDAATVEIAIDTDGNGTLDTVGPVTSTTVVGNTVQFTHDLSGLSQGLSIYRYEISVSDIGEGAYTPGPVSTTTSEIVLAKDDAAPSAPVLTQFDNGFAVKVTGFVGSNLNNAITLDGTASDAVRAAAVEVKVGAKAYSAAGNTGTHYSTWNFADADVSGIGSPLAEGPLTVLVKAIDVFGKETIESFVFNIDSTGPVATIDNPTAASLVNGSFQVTGSSSDTYTVSNMYYYVEDTPGSAPVDVTTWPTATGTTSWNYRFDSTSRANGEKTLNIAAQDNAGNIGTTVTRLVNFDDFLNQPVIRLTGLYASDLRGTMSASTTTTITDPSLIGNGDIEPGWVISFSDGSTTRAITVFNGGTGQLTWASALAAAFPAGSGYTISAPVYTVDSTGGSDIVDAALVGNATIAAGWSVIFDTDAPGVTRLITGFASGSGTITLTSVPGGVAPGTTYRVLPKTLLAAGASISGTLSDDDGIDTATIEIAMDLNNDGDYLDAGEPYQAVSSTSGSGTTASFTHNLASLAEGQIVYKMKVRADDVGQPAYSIAAVTEETDEIFIAKDDGSPNSPVLTSFENGYYGSPGVAPKAADIENSFIDDRIILDGTASDGVAVASVDVNVDGLGYQAATGTTSWSYTRTGLTTTNGANVPVLVRVTDYWGRQTVTSFTFKGDTADPTISFPAFGRKLNNTETVQGTSGDLNSSIHAVYIWHGTGAPPAFDHLDPTANSWTAAGITGTTTWSYALDTVAIHPAATDQAYNLAFTSVDQAGNFTTLTRSETINQDSDRPAIDVSNIGLTDTAATNRFDSNPRIIGTASDDDGVDRLKILISIDGSIYVAVTNPPAADGTANGIVTFSHELVDIAGTLDSSTTTTLTDSALIGKDQIVVGGGATPVWEVELPDSSIEDVTAFDTVTGEVTFAAQGVAPVGAYTLRLKEGTHTASLRVGDIASAVYNEGTFDRATDFTWEQSDGDATAGWQDDPTDFAVDTSAPVITFSQLFMADRYTGTYGGSDINETNEASMAAMKLNNDWTLSGNAADGALSTVTYKVDGGAATGLTPDGSGNWNHTFDWLTGASPGQGSHTITITAADTYGKSTVKTLSVIYDSVEPAVNLSSPDDTTPADFVFDDSVNGTVYMTGSFGEAAVVTLAAGRNIDQEPYDSVTAIATWSYNFNSALLRNSTDSYIVGDTNQDGIKNGVETFLGDTNDDGVEDAGETWVYDTQVYLEAIDDSGNVAPVTYTVRIDNNSDRPIASITLPSDNSYRSGEILISGLTSDDAQADDGVASVWIQIDANGDADFTDSHAFPGGATGGAGNDPYEDESVWYKVPDGQLISGAAWSLAINGNSSLDAAATAGGITTPTAVTEGDLYATNTGFSGMVNIRVLAIDNHSVVGAPSADTTVFLDESYPEIKGISVDGGTYTSGLATLVKGQTLISTLFSDDQGMLAANLQIKYNQESFAAIDSNNIYTTTWNGSDVFSLKKNGTTPVEGTVTSATTTSMTSGALNGLSLQTGMVVYFAQGTRLIDTFDDPSDTITWVTALSGIVATDPFIVAEPMVVDTQGVLGVTDYLDSEGPLTITIKATDQTNQAIQSTIDFNVDNQRPTGEFNHNDSLTFVGADKYVGLYTFEGNDQTENLLLGEVIDSGTVSEVAQVSLYFLKDTDKDGVYDTDGTDKFWDPRSDKVSTDLAPGHMVNMYPTGGVVTDSIPYPPNPAYIIKVDKRTENLVYDTDGLVFGDMDGFEESLLTKAGYDEWKVYFNTLYIPDGPIWIFAIYEDAAGNTSYQRINAQVSNEPPSIDSFDLNGVNYDTADMMIRDNGQLEIGMNVSDAQGIDTAQYGVTIDTRYTDAGITTDPAFTPFAYGPLGFDYFHTAGAAFAEVTTPLNIFTKSLTANTYTTFSDAALADGPDYTGWYVYFRTDDSYRALTASDRVVGSVDFASITLGALDTAELVYLAGTVDSGTTTTVTDTALDGLSDITGLRVLFADEALTEVHYITNYDDATDTITFDNARAGNATGNYRITPYYADLWYQATAEVQDTDGNSVFRSFKIWVKNVDNTAPTMEIDALTRAHVPGTGTTLDPYLGYIEEAAFSAVDGADADVSGQINLTGVAWDDDDVASVTLSLGTTVRAAGTIGAAPAATASSARIAAVVATGTTAGDLIRFTSGAYSGSEVYVVLADTGTGDVTWTPALAGAPGTGDGVSVEDPDWRNVNTLTLQSSDPVLGTDYTWSYAWTTTDDYGAITNNAGYNRKIRIQTIDDSGNIGTQTDLSADPSLTVDVVPYVTEITRDAVTQQLKTFRSRYGAYSVYHGEIDIQVDGFNLDPTWVRLYGSATGADTNTSDTLTFNDVAAPYTGFTIDIPAATRSGHLRINVAGVEAVNNANSTETYNTEYGTDSDESDWTDDRFFHLWQTGDYFGTAAYQSPDPQHPSMTMVPGTSRLLGAWSSYDTSDVFFAGVNTDAAPFVSRIYHTFDTAEYTDFALESTSLNDGNSPTSTNTMSIAFLGNNSSDGNYSYGHVVDFTYERTTNYIDGDVENDGAGNLSANNVQWTRANFDNWYYQGEGLTYDAQLYQFQAIKTVRSGNNVHWAYYDKQSKTVKYAYVATTNNSEAEIQSWINLDGTDTDNDGGEGGREVTNGIARTTSAGEFVALVLDDQNYPVVIYYDILNQTLRLAYSDSATPTTAANWTRQTVIPGGDPNNITTGKHISAIVDDEGLIHITFWSEDTGYLYYIKSNNDPDGGAAFTFDNSQIVDDTGTAGVWSDITLDRSPASPTDDRPYITYLNTGRVNTKDGLKIAYFDAVKGDWEYAVAASATPVVEKRLSIEYKQGGTPTWDAAIGYSSPTRYEAIYYMPTVPTP